MRSGIERTRLWVTLAACLLLSPSAFASSIYTQIDIPGATATNPLDINNLGQILGIYYDGSSRHLFLMSGGSTTTLPVAVDNYTGVVGLNDAGHVLGSSQGGYWLWDGITVNPINLSLPPSYTEWRATAFGNDDVIGGAVVMSGGSVVENTPFIYSAGNLTILPGLGDYSSYHIEAITTGGTLYARGSGHDDHGMSTYRLDGSVWHRFDLGNWYDINDSGVILDSSNGVIKPPYGAADREVIAFPGASFTESYGINDRGQVVGYFYGDGSYHGFVAEPTPEPSTYLTFAAGAGAILLGRFRRRRAA